MIIIDRFEGDFAVCEDCCGREVRIRRAQLSSCVREGDCLRPEADGKWAVDPEETRRRRKLLAARLRRLRERKK